MSSKRIATLPDGLEALATEVPEPFVLVERSADGGYEKYRAPCRAGWNRKWVEVEAWRGGLDWSPEHKATATGGSGYARRCADAAEAFRYLLSSGMDVDLHDRQKAALVRAYVQAEQRGLGAEVLTPLHDAFADALCDEERLAIGRALVARHRAACGDAKGSEEYEAMRRALADTLWGAR